MEDFVLTLVLSDSGFQGWILQRAQLTFLTWPCSTTEDLHHKYLFNWNKPASTKAGKHTPPHRHTHTHTQATVAVAFYGGMLGSICRE